MIRRTKIVIIFIFTATVVFSQKRELHTLKMLQATPVKDQAMSSTCWSFATVSFIESELLREGKDAYDLSEMFVVRNVWPAKIAMYLRMQGKSFLSPGGQPHDVFRAITAYGIVPENVYPGIATNEKSHDHSMADTLIYAAAVALLKAGAVPDVRNRAVESLLNVCFGTPPDTFSHHGVRYTPKEFATFLGFDADQYIQLTSLDDEPYYRACIAYSRYNWAHEPAYNIPFEVFSEVVKNAIGLGYTVLWNGDVSEKEFMHDEGIAVAPAKEWSLKDPEEKNQTCCILEPEIRADEMLRNALFESRATKVDHVMHIVGTAADQKGNLYYIIKNSWGKNSNYNGGYIYMSESYFLLKTVTITLNKTALPKHLTSRLKI